MGYEKVNDPILVPNVATPIREKVSVAATAEELEQAKRTQSITKTSLLYPSPSATLPLPFSMQGVNVVPGVVPSLGQKISNLSGIEGTDRVNAAKSQAFPKANVAGSIYDIAAEPVEVPVTRQVEEPSVDLEDLESTLDELAQAAQEKLEVVEEAVADLSEEELEEIFPDATPFPNLAREIMNLGIGMEGFQTSKLASYKKQGDKYKEKINLLLELSSRLPKLSAEDAPPEGLKQEIMGKIFEIHEKLKAEGIEIFPGLTRDSEISKEQLAAANSNINHHIDACRTSLQELFTTKISVVIQFLSMMNEVMKKIAEKDDQAREKRTNYRPTKMMEELLNVVRESDLLTDAQVEQFYAYAFAQYRAGALERAAEIFHVLCARRPFEARFWFGFAAALQEEKKYEGALRAWAMTALLDKNDPYPHFHAAECYFSVRNLADAALALKETEGEDREKSSSWR